jgi:hypothetical protein
MKKEVTLKHRFINGLHDFISQKVAILIIATAVGTSNPTRILSVFGKVLFSSNINITSK